MTTAAIASIHPRPGLVQPVTQGAVIRSEWIKLRTLRSSWIAIGVTTVGVIAISAVVCYFTKTHFAQMRPQERAHFDTINTAMTGVTRPLGASFADYISKPRNTSGIGYGDGPTALVFAVAVAILVTYLMVVRPDIQRRHD